MELYLDTANVDEIKEIASYGLLDGVTTNPSLIAKSGRNFKDVIKEICSIVSGPVSAEVLATKHEDMLKEADELVAIAKNVVIKVPLIPEGLKAVVKLTEKGISTNVTLCFSAPQALLAAKAGATYISPFIGRVDDTSWDGMELISEIREIYDNYGFETKILAASIRGPMHLKESALRGADCATMPISAYQQLFRHPLTDIGLEKFLEDAKKLKW
ncbi:fructose-6-phosphate aldolase [Leptospira fluminis]|uniref:Probable transaldolase n=1 Tax=Leptospira fluminis TaxID=2484979 RepID=A0A4R9GMV5_9LEPT|nr:fructose-6-phosphate aldolase [Leptospira fluminis]TGK17507.1 fructose-6-phosphate aldolase [Leptospira fluminis]